MDPSLRSLYDEIYGERFYFRTSADHIIRRGLPWLVGDSWEHVGSWGQLLALHCDVTDPIWNDNIDGLVQGCPNPVLEGRCPAYLRCSPASVHLIQMNGSLTDLCRPGWQVDGDPFMWIRCAVSGKYLRCAGQRTSRTIVWHLFSLLSWLVKLHTLNIVYARTVKVYAWICLLELTVNEYTVLP